MIGEEVIAYYGDAGDGEELFEVQKLVRCKDCKWYEKPHIKYNDGTRKHFDSESEIEFVTADIGINVGGRCIGHKTYCTAHDRENPDDYEELVIFRNTDDFCSYGERSEIYNQGYREGYKDGVTDAMKKIADNILSEVEE